MLITTFFKDKEPFSFCLLLSVAQRGSAACQTARRWPGLPATIHSFGALTGCLQKTLMVHSGNLGNTENSPFLGGAGNHINLLFTIHYCILVALGENLRSSLGTGEIRGLSCFLDDLMLELPSF